MFVLCFRFSRPCLFSDKWIWGLTFVYKPVKLINSLSVCRAWWRTKSGPKIRSVYMTCFHIAIIKHDIDSWLWSWYVTFSLDDPRYRCFFYWLRNWWSFWGSEYFIIPSLWNLHSTQVSSRSTNSRRKISYDRIFFEYSRISSIKNCISSTVTQEYFLLAFSRSSSLIVLFPVLN
jgi:hypothetical protein